MGYKVKITDSGIQKNSDTAFVTWTFTTKIGKTGKTGAALTDEYKVTWLYATGDGHNFTGTEGTQTNKDSTYSPPDNATKVKCKIKPVAKTHKVNKKDTPYFTGEWKETGWILTALGEGTPAQLSAPTVTVEKFKMTSRVDTDNKYAKVIEFQVVKDDSTTYKKGKIEKVKNTAEFVCDIEAGHKYKVRCRGLNQSIDDTLVGIGSEGDWSEYSENVETIPGAASGISVEADSSTSAKVIWDADSNAESYEVQYTTNQSYFDTSSEVSSQTVTESTAYITGLSQGETWYFRVRSVNENGEGAWSDIVSLVVGTDPSAPTTWSNTSTAKVGDSVILYWVHNTEDGSSQVSANLELSIDGEISYITVDNNRSEAEKDKTSSYTIDTSQYSDGAEILWRVQTKGVTDEYGDWSVIRSVKIYAPPTMTLRVTDVSPLTGDSGSISDNPSVEDITTLTTLPFYITAFCGPANQKLTGMHVVITAKQYYETVDESGMTKAINVGDEVYSTDISYAYTSEVIYDFMDDFIKSYAEKNILGFALGPGNVIFENAIDYTITVTVTMDSGLTVAESADIHVSWADEDYICDAGITVDSESLSAYIMPYCADNVEEENTEEDTGDSDLLTSNVTLAVYRRQYDGGLVKIMDEIPNTGYTVVTDPHPALDYARYRIVATSQLTGRITFTDLPGIPVNEASIILQWEEQWSSYDSDDSEDEYSEPSWSGSLLRLPYNVSTQESNSKDVTLAKYIGREHPVSYYGTQVGRTETWTADIPKDDEETIYALRRLAVYEGNVYVRSPSGIGYWAKVEVSFPINSRELTSTVTLDITRVEGGV